MNNPTIDLVIRIKNGYMSGKRTILGVHSKMNEQVLAILKKGEYVADYTVDAVEGKKVFKIELLYRDNKPSVADVKIHSTPGRRVYTQVKEVKTVLGGIGMSVLSTPKGILNDTEARKAVVGGELLFEIW